MVTDSLTGQSVAGDAVSYDREALSSLGHAAGATVMSGRDLALLGREVLDNNRKYYESTTARIMFAPFPWRITSNEVLRSGRHLGHAFPPPLWPWTRHHLR